MAEQPDFEADPLTEDDVEGHGLREVAVGISAAAVVGAGGAAAFASSTPGPPHPIGKTVVSAADHLATTSTDDVVASVHHVVQGAALKTVPPNDRASRTSNAHDSEDPPTQKAPSPASSIGNPAGTARRIVANVKNDVTKVADSAANAKASVAHAPDTVEAAAADVLNPGGGPIL